MSGFAFKHPSSQYYTETPLKYKFSSEVTFAEANQPQ